MKKFVLAFGIFICASLFFFVGSLVGYTVYDTKLDLKVSEKQARKPSKFAAPIIGRIVQTKISTPLRSGTRIPTPAAVARIKTYVN